MLAEYPISQLYAKGSEVSLQDWIYALYSPKYA
ncbi:hypothetical protein R69608_07568 [Paraburkholderia nemoris]|nr:hypothetical protein R69608_07568 [Paraburkholderia nemoris]